MHVPQRRGTGRRGLSGTRWCEVRVVQPRVDGQPLQNGVSACVCACSRHISPGLRLYALWFAGNICKCDNGAAQIGADCPVNGDAKCTFCNNGWTINHARTACIRKSVLPCERETVRASAHLTLVCVDRTANICKCENGVPAAGAGCPVDGATKCAFCNTGWTINYERTKCNCA